MRRTAVATAARLSGARLRIVVDPIKKTYAVGVQDREVVLEELRFLSGFTGMYSKDDNTAFDYFQVAGDGQPDAPSFFLKSNERQLDHLAYMALLDDAIYIFGIYQDGHTR